ncbi:MAG: CMP-N-acetylneuraminic acid synthetase [Clostridiales bacterium]|nr:CMP-N-acetylneuraminic acid synthetase [Clostridiales bacterium]
MKTVAFVPIKLNNERTPGKNIKEFQDGTPLMHFVQKNLVSLKKEGLIDEIYCYCSQKEVLHYLIDGVELLKRPEELDRKETKGGQIYDAFVRTVVADVYVLAHATSPFVTSEHIGDCIKKVQSGEYDSAFCAKKIQNFLWQDDKPLNFELSNPLRTQDMKPIYMELSTPYVFTRETFLKYHSRSGVKPYICEASEVEAIDIDYPEDFNLADVVYMNLLK